MGFLDDLIEQTGGDDDDPLGLGPDPDPTHADAVVHDRFDEARWEETKDVSPGLRNMVKDLGKEHDYVEDLCQDVFNLAMKGDPDIRPMQDMLPTHVPHAPTMAEFAESKQITELRQYTRGDQYSSAMATVAMQPAIEQAYNRMEEARALAEAAAELADAKAQAAADALNAAGMADAHPLDPAAAAAAQALLDALAAAQGAAGNAQQAAQDAAAAAAHGTQQALDAAARKAAEERQEEDDLMRGFGVEDGELKRMDFAERAALAKRLKGNRLAKFAKLIGQYRTFAAAERRRKIKHAPSEITGIMQGNDLTRLMPAELINLAVPETEDDFWERFVEGTLWQWELTGTERMGQGPIIAVCDESGSMGADDMGGGATREAWSKAFVLALYDQARRGKRDFHYVGFSSRNQVWHIQIAPGAAGLAGVITMTEHFWGGGTDYVAPLTKALEIVEDYGQRDLAKPDVVFITDDDYGSMDENFMRRWNAAKERLQMRCFGVGLHIRGRAGALASVSDNVRLLASLANGAPNAVADIFRTI